MAFVDSDDTISSNMYFDMLSYLVDNKLDCVESGYNKITLKHSEKIMVTEKDCILPDKSSILQEAIKPLIKYSKASTIFAKASVCNKVFLKHIITDNCIRFNEKKTTAEDWEFVIEYYAKCSCIGFLSQTYYNYIRSGVLSLSNTYSDWYQDSINRRKKISCLFPSLDWHGNAEIELMLLAIKAVGSIRSFYKWSEADGKIKDIFVVAQNSGIYTKPIPKECSNKQRRTILELQNAINMDDYDKFKRITYAHTNLTVLITDIKRTIKCFIKRIVVG